MGKRGEEYFEFDYRKLQPIPVLLKQLQDESEIDGDVRMVPIAF